ncbi:S subunit [Maribacter dokdonensis]|uniref:restriction endonuclease subunit S n=1 Tax=Maribacter dokdonensis TaxID=320912 RepID=UPI001B2AC081|nr:restriction endonuclease subunit S [Maribacter dokdonensis]CAG2534352.1 S subunit [Maribacter dokdonensis]
MPENWKTFKFEELYDIASGLSKSRDQFGFGYPFVTFKDVFYNWFLPDKLGDLANTNEKEQIKGGIKKGDIILTRTSETLHELGMSSVALKDYPNSTFNGFCKRLRQKEKSTIEIEPVFMAYFLRSKYFRNEISKYATMTTRASLNIAAINSLSITLPPFDEQQKIASILKPLDDKIENNLAMNKALEDMAMALYKHWFVDFGPFQEGKFIDSELGKIPEGWEVKELGELVKILGGYAFKGKDFKDVGESVIKIKNISNNLVSIEGSNCIAVQVAEKTNPKFQISPGSFLVAMTGAEVGKVGVVPNYGRRMWLNQRVGMISKPAFKYADILVGIFLQSTEGYEIIQNLAYGSAQPNISSSGIESISIVIPNDLSIIIDELNQMNNWHLQRISNYTENQTLTQIRDTILLKLISGEVRLKEFEKEITAAL